MTILSSISRRLPRQALLLPALFATASLATSAQAVDLVGLNFSGATFAAQVLPGVNDRNFIFPAESHFQQWSAKGVKLVRFPILWERLQPSMGVNLDPTYAGLIDRTLGYAQKYGVKVILDLHNYARYQGKVIGAGEVPYEAFQNLMTRVAQRWGTHAALYGYDIMNEPHDAVSNWPTAAQYGIDGVRVVDSTHPIFIEGNGWADTTRWPQWNDALLKLKDPANNLIFMAQAFFDTSLNVATLSPSYGVERLKPFVSWLKTNNKRGFIGGFGVPDTDARWLPILDGMLAYLKQNCIPATYWAAGPGWGTYNQAVEPINGKDRPQWAVLAKYLDKDSCAGIGPQVTPTATTPPKTETATSGATAGTTGGTGASGTAGATTGTTTGAVPATGSGTTGTTTGGATTGATTGTATGTTANAATSSKLTTVEQLYLAYYGRAADAGGLNYWASRLASDMSVEQLAATFAANGESTALYGALSGAALVNKVYQNLYGRSADSSGSAYWSSRLTNGVSSRATLPLDVMRAAAGDDKTAFDKKVSAALAQGTATTTTPTPAASVQPVQNVVQPVTGGTVASAPLSGYKNIPLGVVGHDNSAAYPPAEMEARLQVLAARNLRTYRSGEYLVMNLPELDRLVALARKYNITLRPVITHKLTQAQAYALAKRYANDIKIWEVGNEQDYSKAGAQDRINTLVGIYRGIKQASDELGANLKTTINVMACNSDDRTATARCPGDRNGAMWFLDQARASGFNFDYISFHYYPYFDDKGYWMDMYLGQMRAMATKYKTKVFFNEMNCGNVYQGNTDGGRDGDRACYDSVKQMLTVLNTSYKDVVAEINVYELLDEPSLSVIHERHFGMMYDLKRPKPIFDMVTSFAK
ncbi:cellulase family glycosylhydrolase [Pseudomonas oryzihabitans]|uniref:cellulase family glycosylhydrolase n=1 Tax=Pseudomonas oryzihabitans TaxID=47885 RepID=UPI00119F6DC0|nr:cellulase family glycosylhydrolase [Pseudomonas oryzihabitans]